MTTEHLKSFLQAIAESDELKMKISGAASLAAIHEIAKSEGYDIAVAELEEHWPGITEQELEGMSGALTWSIFQRCDPVHQRTDANDCCVMTCLGPMSLVND